MGIMFDKVCNWIESIKKENTQLREENTLLKEKIRELEIIGKCQIKEIIDEVKLLNKEHIALKDRNDALMSVIEWYRKKDFESFYNKLQKI
jgi:hypothetical protein